MEQKYKVGDKVKILSGEHQGEIDVVMAIDPEWEYPYELENHDELYAEDELMSMMSDAKEKTVEIPAESSAEKTEKFYLIVYNEKDGRTLLFDPEERLLIDEKYDVDPQDNPYFMGFFDGLNHIGHKFSAQIQYLK